MQVIPIGKFWRPIWVSINSYLILISISNSFFKLNGLQYVFQIPKISSLFRVLTNLDDDMCEATPLCSAQSKATPAMLSSGGDSLECQFCEKVWKIHSIFLRLTLETDLIYTLLFISLDDFKVMKL